MRVVFMGTPDFAVPAFEALCRSEHEVVAVYTQPPRPAGRGKKLRPSPIQERAEQQGIPVYHPLSLKSQEVQAILRETGADVAVVAAYGLLLPKAVLEMFPHGCLNIHPSLLPRWRGASPIQRTIMAGDVEAGVCIMRMDEGLDTGDVMSRQTVAVPELSTAGSLHDILASKGADMLLGVLEEVLNNTAHYAVQSDEGVTYAHKLHKEDGAIDWARPAVELDAHIRGMSPWPCAFFRYGDQVVKVLAAEWGDSAVAGEPGMVMDDRLTVACGNGFIRPTHVQRAGKRPMTTEEFLRGMDIPAGTVLG